MRFRSENGFSRLWVLSGLCAATFMGAAGAAVAQTPAPSPTPTPRTVLLVPPDPYVWTPESNSVYIASLNSALHGVNTRENYRSWTLTTTSAAAGADQTEMFYFDVQIDEAVSPAAGSRLVLTVESEVVTGSPVHKFVPIAAVGDTRCSAGNTSCLFEYRPPSVDQSIGAAMSGVALAADFGSAPRSVRVGFYFGDICAALGASGVRANGCSESVISSPDTPTTGAPIQFSLIFRLRQVSLGVFTESESATLTAATATKELRAVITVQSDGPTVSCTTSDIYFPGDAQIMVDTSKITTAIATGGAPIHEVVVSAEKLPGSVSQTIPPSLDDDVVAYIAPTGTHGAGTFENTTDGLDNQYVVQFNVMDQAGVMPLPSSTCLLGDGTQGVQTSEIQSFLGSNACFIATASFQSTHHPVVEELRIFRDQILARFWLGRRFVAAYYRWSPRIAAVVDRYPLLRLPSLFLLAPFEFLAALLLRPVLAGLWILGWSGLGFGLFVRRRQGAAG